jgi:ceramide glucosyltransferase
VTPLGALAIAWAAPVMAVQLEAARRAFARARATERHDAPRPARVLVVRPCAEDAPWLTPALLSIRAARRSFTMRYRVAVASPSDTAHGVAMATTRALAQAGHDAAVVLTSPRGPNFKVSQVARVVELEPAGSVDVVIVADGDVDLTDVDLDALVAPLLEGPGAGAVWAPPIEAGGGDTLGDRAAIALLGGSLHAFPVLAGLDRRGLVGKLFAVQRDALEAIGGFGALASHLGEDMELARRLLAVGRRVDVSSVVAPSLSSGRSWGEVEARFARWITVIRAQRPSLLPTYPLLFFSTVPLVALVAVSLPALPAAAIGVGVLVTRLGVALAAAKLSRRRLSFVDAVVDTILADVLLARSFARALRSRRVTWRDVALVIDRGGLLHVDGDTPNPINATIPGREP